jgi:DNA-directed RNA polymerase subunit RPC12/RpoP
MSESDFRYDVKCSECGDNIHKYDGGDPVLCSSCAHPFLFLPACGRSLPPTPFEIMIYHGTMDERPY